jgi:DNA-binding NarL/FixJ family response regulator
LTWDELELPRRFRKILRRIQLQSSKKTLLVCTENGEVEKYLMAAGCNITSVNDGGVAISRAGAESFDAAILVSTGRQMGLAETAFSLREVAPSMPIIILTGNRVAGQTSTLAGIVAGLIPNTSVLDVEGLESFFRSLQAAE